MAGSIKKIEVGDGAEEFPLSKLNSPDTIILGIGNISRGDDGLGWAFLDAVKETGTFKGETEYRYLLLVEDAALFTRYANVIFVDAHNGPLKDGFTFERTIPHGGFEFSSHIIPPGSILYLAEELYGSKPEAWTLAIGGEHWELGKGLSKMAQKNLEKAIAFFNKTVL